MALGDTYNNNQQKNNYSPNVYSQYGYGNSESAVDPTKLSAGFWNNMLKISISPKIQSNDDNISYDYKNNISIYLNHTSARLLADEIEAFKQDPNICSNVGVPSGAGLITLSNGKEFGINCPCLTIRKIDENGEVTSSFAYQFKQNYHYAIRNYNEKTKEFDKIYNDNLELDQLQTLLIEYYKAMTGALAYSVIENSKYDHSRLNTKVEMIAEKLGVQFKKSNGNSKSSSSFFNSKEPRNFNQGTLDDLEAQMED